MRSLVDAYKKYTTKKQKEIDTAMVIQKNIKAKKKKEAKETSAPRSAASQRASQRSEREQHKRNFSRGKTTTKSPWGKNETKTPWDKSTSSSSSTPNYKAYQSGHKSASAMSSGARKTQEESTYKTKGGRFYTGFVRNAMLGGLPEVKHKEIKNTTSYKAGAIAGDLVSYGLGYGAASKSTKVLGASKKLAGSKAGTKAVEKLATREVAKKRAAKELAKKGSKDAGEKAINKLAKKNAKDTVEKVSKNMMLDATVGTTMDATRAKGEGLEGKDFVKYMAANAAANLVLGGAMDFGGPALGRALGKTGTKAGKNALSKAIRAINEKKVAKESAKKAGKTFDDLRLERRLSKAQERLAKSNPEKAFVNKELKRRGGIERIAKETGQTKAAVVNSIRRQYEAQNVRNPFEGTTRAERKAAKDALRQKVKDIKAGKEVSAEDVRSLRKEIQEGNFVPERPLAKEGTGRYKAAINSQGRTDIGKSPQLSKIRIRGKTAEPRRIERNYEGNIDDLLSKIDERDIASNRAIVDDAVEKIRKAKTDKERVRYTKEAADEIADSGRIYDMEDVDDDLINLANDLRQRKFKLRDGGDIKGGRNDTLAGKGREYFGVNKVTAAKKGDRASEAVDNQWGELQELYGKEWFPDDITNPSDQMEHIFGIMESARNARRSKGEGIPFDDRMRNTAYAKVSNAIWNEANKDVMAKAQGRAARSLRLSGTKARKEATDAMKDTAFVRSLREDLRAKKTTLAAEAEKAGVSRAEYVDTMYKRYEGENSRLLKNEQTKYLEIGSPRSVKSKKRGYYHQSKLKVITSKAEELDFIRKAVRTHGEGSPVRPYGLVGDKYADAIQSFNNVELDIHNSALELRGNDIWHLWDHVGKPPRDKFGNLIEGGLPLSEKDVFNLTDYINKPDYILDVTPTREILLGKKINGYSIIVEIADDQRRALYPKTMYAVDTKKFADMFPQKKPFGSPEISGVDGKVSAAPTSSAFSKNSIRQEGTTVNTNGYQNFGQKPGEVSQGAQTLREAPFQNEESRKAMDKLIKEGEFNKYTQSHKDAAERATTSIEKNGYDATAEKIHNYVQEGKAVNQTNIAEAHMLAKHYIENGEYEKANSVLIDVANIESEAGRNLQAMRMFRAMTPEGRVQSTMRNIQKLSDKKGKDIKVPEELLNRLRDANTEKEIDAATKAIRKDVWDQLPASWTEKANAWRYLAMLGNPRTHVRNMLGNAIFYPVRTTRNIIATGIEKALVPKGQRTKAIVGFSGADRDLVKMGRESWDSGVGEALRSNQKWSETTTAGHDLMTRPEDSRVFKSNFLDSLSKLNGKALDKEDILFMRPAYEKSYASYLKSNGITRETATHEMLEKAREYASQEALEATYRDYSIVADWLAKTKRYANMKTSEIPTKFDAGTMLAKKDQQLKKVGGLATEALVPFAKTPINILRRGIDYSPVKLASGVTKILGAGGDNMKLIKGISELSSGLTGTGILALGAYMGQQGLAEGSIDYNSKEGNYQKMMGQQEYSIKMGDNTYTMDWAAPICLPFFIGVEAGKAAENDEVGQLLTSVDKLTDPIFNLSMLQSLNSALSNPFSSGNSIPEFAKNTAESYIGQYLPTLGGQIARTIQKDTTTTTATNKNKTIRDYQGFINQMKNKVPGLANTNAPKVDDWGRKETKETPRDYALAALQNFISPGYGRKINTTEVDEEIQSLLREGADSSVIPKVKPDYTYTIGRDEINITPKEYAKFKQDQGKAAKKKLEELFASDEYKDMNLEEKQKAVANVYTEAKLSAKKKLFADQGYTATDIAWELDLNKRQREKYGSKEKFTKELDKAGMTLKEYKKASDAGVTIKQYVEAKKNGVSVEQYIASKKIIDNDNGYGSKTAALLEGGFIKNYKQASEVYDIKEQSWNAAVKLLNQGYHADDLAKMDGDWEADDKEIKKLTSNGYLTKAALTEWVSHQKPPKGVKISKRAYRAYLWATHGYKNWQSSNPYE